MTPRQRAAAEGDKRELIEETDRCGEKGEAMGSVSTFNIFEAGL